MKNIIRIVKKEFNTIPENIVRIKSGKIARSFYFSANKKDFIIRFNTSRIEFDKDRFCAINVSKIDIPIPRILFIGKASRRSYYSISEKCTGQLIDNFDKQCMEKLLIKVFDLLFLMKRIDIKGTRGFGDFNGQGMADFSSWKSYLLNTSLTDNLSRSLYGKATELIGFCPEVRNIIHGDLGFNNILSDGIKITGIIDWGDAKYGDFLYDLAWMDFWLSEIPFEKIFMDYIKSMNIRIENYHQRVTCYKCFLAINILRFLKINNDIKTFTRVKNKAIALIS